VSLYNELIGSQEENMVHPVHQHKKPISRRSLTRFAWLSIAAALTTIALKTGAYLLTSSVGLLSDAAESIVNLVGAVMALSMLIIAARPADPSHTYGHSKAEYFSSGVEGTLILVASAGIIISAVIRLLNPQPLEQLGIGLVVSTAASIVNLIIARILISAGKRENSITLESDGQHLMTDVWTSVGVIGGVAVVALTGWAWLDSLVAVAVALNIIWTGVQLVRRSVAGLMDASLPTNEQEIIEGVMIKYRGKEVDFHALRTRQAASRRFVTVHMLVPGDWTVHDAHHFAEDFENDIRAALGETVITTHVEPIEDELSMHDILLEQE
jgi:cation diffusion facilitator family transporter